MSATGLGNPGPPDNVLISLGVDYITATAVEARGFEPLHNYASGLFRAEADSGNTPRSWGMAGFKGWRCGSVEVGKREQETMVRLSGLCAQNSWRKVVQYAGNISRLDLQATVRTQLGPTQVIEQHRVEAERNSDETGKRKKVRWVREYRGGYTLYLGQRTSICFGRIYDKFEQCKLDHYRGCVRYEVQFHNKLALRIASALGSDQQTVPRVSSYCQQFFRKRGVSLELLTKPGASYTCCRGRSDAEKNLRWLKESVRPTVMRLIAQGRGDECLRALGLVVDDEIPSAQSHESLVH